MTSGKKHSTLARTINFSLSIALAVVFLLIAFNNVDFTEVVEIVSGANLLWVFIFILLFFTSHYVRTLRWKYILHSVKPNASIGNLFNSLMVGYGVNCVTPKLGEVTRAVLIGKWEGLSRSSMFGTVILERVIDILSLAVSVLIAILISSENIADKFPWLISTLYITAALIFLFVLFLYLTLHFKEKFYGIIVKLLSKVSERIAERAAYIFRMLTEGFFSLKGTSNYIWTISLTALMLIIYAATSYVGLLMLDMQNFQQISFEMGWVIMSISSIGVIIPTPGSTGSYHTLAKSTLVLLYGFSETISAAYAFLTHIISYILFIFTALIIYFIINKQRENLFKVAETEIEEL